MTLYTTDATNSDVRELACAEIGPSSGAAIREVLDRLGDKWSLLIIRSLRAGPLRFTALQSEVPGISQRMLTHTLRALQRDGLVSRESFDESPPRVEYRLTEFGRTFVPVVITIVNWAVENERALDANHAAWDAAELEN
jgi:DNA-binding HxlR family transcriptional regulator